MRIGSNNTFQRNVYFGNGNNVVIGNNCQINDNIRFDNNSSVTVNDEDALPQVAESKDEYSDDEEELPQDEDSDELSSL